MNVDVVSLSSITAPGATLTSMTAKRRIRRKPEDAERAILDAAETLLKEIRFRDLTVDAVAAAANMRRSNFYNYFKDRNELVMRLVDRIAGEMFAATRLLARKREPRSRRRTAARVARCRPDLEPARRRAGGDERGLHHDEAAQRYFRGGVVQQYIDQIAKLIRREKRQGLTKVANPNEVARALILLNVNYMTERVTMDHARPEAVASVLAQIWVATLYPDAA